MSGTQRSLARAQFLRDLLLVVTGQQSRMTDNGRPAWQFPTFSADELAAMRLQIESDAGGEIRVTGAGHAWRLVQEQQQQRQPRALHQMSEAEQKLVRDLRWVGKRRDGDY